MLAHLAPLLLVLVGCVGALAASKAPPKPGPDGVPIFEGRDFRHPANEPFWCLAHATPGGERTTSCHEIQDWCAQKVAELERKELTVLDACTSRDEVTCMTFYRGDATKTFCYAASADCDAAQAHMLSPAFGASRDQLTACTPLDRSFQPPA